MVYTEYFFKRGLSSKDIFYSLNPFEKIPMLIYLLMIIFDGVLYFIVETAYSEYDIIESVKKWFKSKYNSKEQVKFQIIYFFIE